MKIRISPILTILVALSTQTALAATQTSIKVDRSAAPQASINTKSSSVAVKKDGPTASYRLMIRNLKGEDTTAPGMFPESLSVTSHNLGLKVPLTESLSVNLGAKYLKNDITLVGRRRSIDVETQGMSDTTVGLGLEQKYQGKSRLAVNFGVSVPTGSYEEEYQGRLVSYPGQLGSGTYDLTQSISYNSRWKDLTYNGMLLSKIRTGKNDLDYRLGNQVSANLSASYWFIKYLALTTRGYYKTWGKVAGRTNPRDVFAASGSRWSANLGLTSGIYMGKKLAAFIEAGAPVYRDQTGPLEGLESEWYMNSFVQSTF